MKLKFEKPYNMAGILISTAIALTVVGIFFYNYQFDRGEAYGKIVAAILVLLFLISVLLIIVFWRNNKLKFYKKEYEFEKEKNILLKHKEHSVMLDSIGQSVMATNNKGEIIFWNKASEKLYGWAKSEVIGKNTLEIIYAKMSASQGIEIFKKLQKGEPWTGEFLVRKKDGTEFAVKVTDTPVYNSKNELTSIVSVSEDLTEQKEREKEILLAKEKAEEINRLKSNFLANMSHEVRTPLIGILGYAEMIMDENYDAELKEKIGVIYKSGRKLNETLDTILDISKVESEKVDIVYEKFNLGELINESVTLYKILAEEKGVALKYLTGTNELIVNLDKRMLSKIINNLLSNSIKYTNSGEITISTFCSNGIIKIEVQDTGIGIPEDKLDIVFEPFRQVTEGYNRMFEGTGLGLTITKILVELLKGKISLESKYGAGSKFTVEFPINAMIVKNSGSLPEKEKEKKMEKEDFNLKKKNILLVEDDDVNARIILRFLEKEYNAEWVKTGIEAIELSEKKKFDCILMDISLKGDLDGLMTTARLRKTPSYELTPIIAVTAYAMVGDKERFLNGGCNYYISKPFSRNELLLLIKNIFS